MTGPSVIPSIETPPTFNFLTSTERFSAKESCIPDWTNIMSSPQAEFRCDGTSDSEVEIRVSKGN